MGSLVMSQVAPGLGHQHSHSHSYPHHIMVGGDSQRDSESDSRHQQSNTTASQPPPAPSEPELRPAESQSQPHVTPSSTTRPPAGRAPSTHNSHSVNNHRDGFDQNGFPLSSDPRGLQSSPNSPRLQPTYRSTRSLGGSEATSPSRLRVRDLAHIQSFASQEYLARPRFGGRTFEAGRQYEISSMPVTDIIEMVAGLLTKITTTNDRQHDHLHRPITPQDPSNLSSSANCVLAFHGKNVPSITILSYLSRIHKYCPTTYEVFLSLLVYFDRMTDNFNKRFLQRATQSSRSDSLDSHASSDTLTEQNVTDTPTSSALNEQEQSQTPASDLSQIFVVDSYNIHRLVIAGVTCASKFFSDVFYTNSRYAKVGGLPLAELNNLELQFLILNDFRLSVPVEELEAYGTMLVDFYAREVVAQQQAAEAQHQQMQQMSPGGGDEMYMGGTSRPPATAATT